MMGENLACVICEWIIKVEPSTFLHAFRIKAGEANRDPDFMAAFQGLDSKPLPFASLPFRQTKPLIFFRSCRAPFIILTSFRERSPLAKYLLLNGRLYWSRRNNGLYYVHQIKTLWAEDVCLSKKKPKWFSAIGTWVIFNSYKSVQCAATVHSFAWMNLASK